MDHDRSPIHSGVFLRYRKAHGSLLFMSEIDNTDLFRAMREEISRRKMELVCPACHWKGCVKIKHCSKGSAYTCTKCGYQWYSAPTFTD